MRSYLSLASVQAKAHKRHNRMTIFCIMLAVILITGVFTMADMEYRHEILRMTENHGNWHIALKNITKEEAEAVSNEAWIKEGCWYDVINYDLTKDYSINGKQTVVCGSNGNWEKIMFCMKEGVLPKNENEIAVSENCRRQFSKEIGDTVSLVTPAGSYEYVISGIVKDGSMLQEYDATGVFVSMESFEKIVKENGESMQPVYYIQFGNTWTIRKTIDKLMDKHSWNSSVVSENTGMLGILGMSSSSYVVGLYGIALILVILVMLAVVLMIAGSMNSNIAERTQYFGMLRCIGTSKAQIRHIVRLEALNWCKKAIPLGIMMATLASWGICAILRYVIGGEWENMPVFKLSPIGIISGTVIGIITVLIAANAPAKRAAKVSPAAGISGNTENRNTKKAANTKFFKVENALGIHHAVSQKKSLVMMTGSFALSIILFLSFSVMIDWIGHALNSNKPYSQDMSVYAKDYASVLPQELVNEIGKIDGIKYVYGRMHICDDITSTKDVSRMDLISYEELQFGWAKDDYLSGDIEAVKEGSDCVMVVFDKNNPLTLGDKIWYRGNELTVTAVLEDSPFSSSDIPTVLCSEETFRKLTGIEQYAVIDIQVAKKAEKDIDQEIRKLIGDDIKLSDRRESKKTVNSTYLAFSLLVYGFLGMIALITVFNINNSISMSVSARNKQYGIMRAIGMDSRQICKMICAETFVYAVSGILTGGILGLLLHMKFFQTIISAYFGTPWTMPVRELLIIFLVVIFASATSVVKPVKRILANTVTETISEL